MRTRHLRHLRRLVPALLTGVLLSVAALLTVPAGAAPRPTRVDAERLPGMLVPRGIDDRGRVLAVDVGGEIEPPDVVVVDGPRRGRYDVTRVGPWDQYRHPLCPDPAGGCFFPLPDHPYINGRGVVGTSIGGHATLWDDGRATDLNGDALGSWLLDLNDRGDALVVRFTATEQLVGVWRRGRFETAHTLPLDVVLNGGRLSERGDVVAMGWVARPPLPSPIAFVHQDGVVTDLVGFAPSGFDRDRRVIGTLDDRSRPFTEQRAAVWDHGEITVLPTLGGRSSAYFANDRGRIAGYSTRPDGTVTTVVWDGDGGGIVDVGAEAGLPSSTPRALNDRGQVLLVGRSPVYGSQAALWDERGAVLLPPSNEPDRSVAPYELNDRGQVAGLVQSPTDLYMPMRWTTRR